MMSTRATAIAIVAACALLALDLPVFGQLDPERVSLAVEDLASEDEVVRETALETLRLLSRDQVMRSVAGNAAQRRVTRAMQLRWDPELVTRLAGQLSAEDWTTRE